MGQRNSRLSWNVSYVGHTCARVTKHTIYDSQVSDHVAMH